jgi:hypothetical protein
MRRLYPSWVVEALVFAAMAAALLVLFIVCKAADAQTTQPAPTVEVYRPGAKLRAGTYSTPGGPLNVIVDVAGVTFVDGPAPSYSPNGNPVFDMRAPNCTIDGVSFDHPKQAKPGDKIGTGPCVLDRTTWTHVTRCKVGNIDEFLFGAKGSVGLVADYNRQVKMQRAYFAYGEGAEGWVIAHNNIAFGSAVEQPIRTSPATRDNGATLISMSKGWVIAHNTIRNEATPDRPDPKGCIDLRQIAGAYVVGNHIYSYPGGGAIAAGPKQGDSRPLYPFETAEGIVIAGNDIHGGGMIQTRMVRGCTVTNNDVFDLRPNVDNGISAQTREESPVGTRQVERLDVTDNRLYLINADASSKPTLRRYGDASLGGITERGNQWLRQPVPATQPTTRAVQ